MRVVVAADSFGGGLSAVEVAAAIETGWRRAAPSDHLEAVPMSDGGPGFVAALHAAAGGVLLPLRVADPLGRPVDAALLATGSTAYLEAAQACGLHLLAPGERDPRRTTTVGVGEMLAAAAATPGVERVVVGLGGSATNDGGAGAWAALGAEPRVDLSAGGGVLGRLDHVTPPPQPRTAIVAATDVDNPLLGPNGASAVYGPQKGADRAAVLHLDDALRRWADLVEVATGRSGTRDQAGSGAAGGLGFGLLALAAVRASGFGVVAAATDLAGRLRHADLVITGEGRFDASSLRGKVVSGVAAAGQHTGVPCIVIAGQVAVGRRDAAAAGVEEVYAVSETLGSVEAALAAGADGIAATAARAARIWSRHG